MTNGGLLLCLLVAFATRRIEDVLRFIGDDCVEANLKLRNSAATRRGETNTCHNQMKNECNLCAFFAPSGGVNVCRHTYESAIKYSQDARDRASNELAGEKWQIFENVIARVYHLGRVR